MKFTAAVPVAGASLALLAVFLSSGIAGADEASDRAARAKRLSANDRGIKAHADRLLEAGRNIFRFDTYGSEAFFGDALQLTRPSRDRKTAVSGRA